MTSLPQFDVAAALYREPALPLYYLDSDPVAAARAVCDVHVPLGLGAAVKVLSAAWHQHNPMEHELDKALPYGHLIRRRAPPASRAQATPQDPPPDPLYEEQPGERAYYLLCGQRIHRPEHTEHALAVWARASVDNYGWVWAYGLALSMEHQYRWRHPHPLTPVLWALEHTPPNLPEGLTQPAPEVPPECQVITEGCYDTPASYRAYYVAHKQALMKWTRRAPPSWLVLDEEERLYKLRNSV